MKCPNCKTIELIISERKNVEIDYCPECRGIWLDRGELDKIIELSTREYTESSKNTSKNNKYDENYTEYKHKNKKKESFLSELFDF